jgi:hypothetical protein
MHSEPMWPVNGEYQCRTCHRKFRVAWEEPTVTQTVPPLQHAKSAEVIAATAHTV